jgi:hypothetical protein
MSWKDNFICNIFIYSFCFFQYSLLIKAKTAYTNFLTNVRKHFSFWTPYYSIVNGVPSWTWSYVVGFTTTCAISAFHHWSCEFVPRSWRVVLDTTLCDKDCQWLATGRWFSLGTPISSINKTDRHDITEILLKVAFTFQTYANNHCSFWTPCIQLFNGVLEYICKALHNH